MNKKENLHIISFIFMFSLVCPIEITVCIPFLKVTLVILDHLHVQKTGKKQLHKQQLGRKSQGWFPLSWSCHFKGITWLPSDHFLQICVEFKKFWGSFREQRVSNLAPWIPWSNWDFGPPRHLFLASQLLAALQAPK